MYYWNEFINEINNQLQAGDILLDAGAGDCHWKNYFSQAIKYIGMDAGVGDSDWDYSQLDIKGDLRAIPLEDNYVDTIISIQVLEHLAEPWQVIQEFHRILKPNGSLFITCPQGEPQHQIPYDFFRYTPFGLRSLLESTGFELVWTKPQQGNFSKIGHDLSHSAKKLPSLGKNPVSKVGFAALSVYLRFLWKIHQPLLAYFEQFEPLQDNPTGHFVRARKL